MNLLLLFPPFDPLPVTPSLVSPFWMKLNTITFAWVAVVSKYGRAPARTTVYLCKYRKSDIECTGSCAAELLLHTHTHTHMHARAHTHTHTQILSLSITHACAHTHIHTHSTQYTEQKNKKNSAEDRRSWVLCIYEVELCVAGCFRSGAQMFLWNNNHWTQLEIQAQRKGCGKSGSKKYHVGVSAH